jgi:hypothetical protein
MLNVNPEILKHVSESAEFDQLLREVNQENPRFRDIPRTQQRIALALLMTGELNSIKEMEKLYIKRPIPDIKEFLTYEYVGDTSNLIYQRWREDLYEVFNPESIIRQWALTGSIGCLSGSTKIKLLNGTTKTIKELSESIKDDERWVYSWDLERNQIAPGFIEKAHKTGINKKVIEVVTNPGGCIKATPDHLFLLSSGQYARADKLKLGDSIRSVYLNIPDTGFYKDYWYSESEGPIHRRVAEYFHDITDSLVHHKDLCKTNNVPKNLIPMEQYEHLTLHANEYWSREGAREQRSKEVSERMTDWQSSYMVEKREEWLRTPKGQKYLEETSKRISELNKNHPIKRDDITFDVLTNLAPSCKSLMELAQKAKCSRQRIYNILAKEGTTYVDFSNQHMLNRSSMSNSKNHKIISVTEVDQAEDVYDLVIPGFNNFGVEDDKGNLIFVHNSGKTTIAVIAQLFNTFRINCLRRPQMSMGADPTKAMNLQLFTTTRGKAKSILYDRVKTFLGVCQHYIEVPSQADFKEFQSEAFEHIIPWTEEVDPDGEFIVFPNNVRIRSGSQPRHALGEDVYGGILDEAEFREGLTHGKVEDTFNLYYEILERIRSRFMGSRFTLMCLMSSIKNTRGVMAKYMDEAKNRVDTKVSQYAIWDTKLPNAIEEEGYFYAMRGTMRHPSKVMNEEEQRQIDEGILDPPPTCEFVKVPNRYKDDFESNTERSLMNLAGRVSLGAETPFDDLTDMVDPSLCPVIDISAPLQGTKPLRDQLPKEYFVRTSEGLRLRRYPGSIKYCHVDLADTGEGGIAIVHKELSTSQGDARIIFVVDFCIRLVSPNRISLDHVRDLLFDFRDLYGVTFGIITADQYQSTQMLQKFEAVNFASVRSGKLSVDTNRIPYDTLSSAIAQDNVKIGKLGPLKRQLESIYFENNKPKSTGRKDCADALCGAIFNSSQNASDVPSQVYEFYGQINTRIEELQKDYEDISF